jgi:hypothetical protein
MPKDDAGLLTVILDFIQNKDNNMAEGYDIYALTFFLNFEPHLGHTTSLCFIPQLTQ